MLVTFDVPVREDAASLAVDTAVESGQPLVLVNLVELSIRPMTFSWGSEVVVMEDVEASLRAPAALAVSLAVRVERLRVVSPRPVKALIELVGELAPGLLVHAAACVPKGGVADPRERPVPRVAPARVRCYGAVVLYAIALVRRQ
jgi:hypothetical protein